MSKRKKIQPDHIKSVRRFLQDLAKAKLETEGTKDLVIKDTSISKSSLEAMVYRGEGGLDAWTELLFCLYGISPHQIASLLAEMKNQLRKNKKLSEGQILFSEICDELSEDKRHFWSGIITAAEELKPPFAIKRTTK